MNIVKKFNGLKGAVMSRVRIEELIQQAAREEQYDIVSRLSALLADHPKVAKFDIDIKEPAIECVPASMAGCFQMDEINEETGLNGVGQQEIYDMVTDMILNTIATVGHLPWQKEWKGSGGNAAKNYVSKKTYTGINFIMLNFEQKEDKDGNPYLVPINFKQPYYLTFKQIQSAKATLRKGSRASRVFYYTPIFAYDNNGQKIRTSDKEKFLNFIRSNGITPENVKKFAYQVPVVKYYNVYRADDCDGLKFPEQMPRTIVEPIEAAQAIIDHYPASPKYTFGGDGAFYLPAMDTINMPVIEDFSQPAFYYSTYFHEIVHSTGHSKRLDRGNDTRRRDGSMDDKKAYAFEELIAELGAVYLCSEAGILFSTKENNAKYLAHWNGQLSKILKEDNRFFFRAAAAAQKGTNHVLDLNADGMPAYQRQAIKKGPLIKPKKKVSVTKSNKKQVINKIVGYALIDNISGKMAASKETLAELEKVYHELKDAKFAKLPPIVREVILVAGKNKLGKVVEVEFKKDLIERAARSRSRAKADPAQLSLLGRKPGSVRGLRGIVNEDELNDNYEALRNEIELSRPVPEPAIVPAPVAVPKSHHPKVMKIGGTGQPSEYFTVAGEVGKFLQRVERKPKESVVITMDGERGAGKTTTLYKFIEAFSAPGNSCLFLSLEEHPESSLAKDKAEKYLSPETIQRLDTTAEVDSAPELYDLVKNYDIIFIDSWQKLVRMIGSIRMDEDLRKKFDAKVFVIIFQQTTDGKTKGGAEIGFDGDIIIKMIKEARFSDNYAYFDKNRYTLIPLETIQYNIANGTCYNPEAQAEPVLKPVEPAATIDKPRLKFNVI